MDGVGVGVGVGSLGVGVTGVTTGVVGYIGDSGLTVCTFVVYSSLASSNVVVRSWPGQYLATANFPLTPKPTVVVLAQTI